jgi:predicted transcriptional regulator
MLGEGQKEVLEAIKKLEEMGEKATIKAIAEFTGKSSGDVRFLLYKLIQKGLIERSQRGTYSLCKNIKSANNANNANNANMLTTLTNQPQPSFVSDVPSFVSDVSDTTNKVLTFLDKKNQGFGEFVSDVSDVSDVINCYPTPNQPTPTPTQTPEGTSSDTSTQRQEEEEVVYLLMPEQEKCPTCGWDVWEVPRVAYAQGTGVGKCLKCGHQSWFKFFKDNREPKGQVVSKEDLPFLLYNPIPVKAEAVLKVFGEVKDEAGNGFGSPDKLKGWLEKWMDKG